MNTTEPDQPLRHVPLHFPMLRLLYSGTAGVGAAQGLALRVGRISIGRQQSEAEGIGLPADRRLSRLHASIEVDASGQQIRIVDEGSQNGTFVNGRQVTESVLRDGDLIRVGSSFLLVRYDPETLLDVQAPPLLGEAPVMRRLRRRIVQVAPLMTSVLLLGESGTGKEVAAQALHAASNRSGPWLAVNCAAIPKELAESQLFGYVAGAFSGARGAPPGFFRAAEGGTLFLDEIGDLPQELQPKLLRALDERAVLPVGSTRPIAYDVRLIAATNRDLHQAVAAGHFRGDLLMRLEGIAIRLPPLRERREDILPLLMRVLPQPSPALDPPLVEALLLHGWPFNVRELVKIGEDLRSRCSDESVLDLSMVAERLRPSGSGAETEQKKSSPLGQIEVARKSDAFALKPEFDEKDGPQLSREALLRLMTEHHGIVARVARAIGRSRRQVGRLLKRHRIVTKEFRD